MAFPLVDGTTGETTDVHAGLVAKRVRCAIATNVTKATALENGDTLDGVTLATGDRVALLGQTSGSENGIWVVAASGAPTRSLDFDENAEVLPGTLIVVSEGTANKDSIWQLTTNATITVDTTALVFFPVHLQGTGSPEGVVTAPVGALYRRTDGSAGTTIYSKDSGTGNTGWGALAASGVSAFSGVVASRSTTQAITTATETAIQFDAADDVDTESVHDPSSNNTRITIPAAWNGKKVLLRSRSTFAGNATGRRLVFYKKNGGATYLSAAEGNTAGTNDLSIANEYLIVSAVTGDYYESCVYHTKGSDLNIQGNAQNPQFTVFTATLMGA